MEGSVAGSGSAGVAAKDVWAVGSEIVSFRQQKVICLLSGVR